MEKKNYSLFNLQRKLSFAKCVISNQRPQAPEFKSNDNNKKGINFDNESICDACKYNEIKIRLIEVEKKHYLEHVTNIAKNYYDCVVPGSEERIVLTHHTY